MLYGNKLHLLVPLLELHRVRCTFLTKYVKIWFLRRIFCASVAFLVGTVVCEAVQGTRGFDGKTMSVYVARLKRVGKCLVVVVMVQSILKGNGVKEMVLWMVIEISNDGIKGLVNLFRSSLWARKCT